MPEEEKRSFSSVEVAIAKGEADIRGGRTVRYTATLMAKIAEKGKQAGKPVKNDVKP